MENKMVLMIIYIIAVYAATVVIQVYQSSTGGYFNLGEAVIYVAAILHGPLIAGIAGGVGAALADATTGYGIFAPATLIIKFTEGYVAGLLLHKVKINPEKARLYAGAIGGVYAVILSIIAYSYWSGEIFLGPEPYSITTYVPAIAWIIVSFILGAIIAYLVARKTINTWEPLALIIAGTIMVTGYFIYEFFVSNPITGRDPWLAVLEIPVNIGQAVIGAAIALPVASWLKRAGYGGEQATG